MYFVTIRTIYVNGSSTAFMRFLFIFLLLTFGTLAQDPCDSGYLEKYNYKDLSLRCKNSALGIINSSGELLIDSVSTVFLETTLEFEDCVAERDFRNLFALKDDQIFIYCNGKISSIREFLDPKIKYRRIGNVIFDLQGHVIYENKRMEFAEVGNFYVSSSTGELEIINHKGEVLFFTDQFLYGVWNSGDIFFVDKYERIHGLNEELQEVIFPSNIKSTQPVQLFGKKYFWVNSSIYRAENFRDKNLLDTVVWHLLDENLDEVFIRNQDGEIVEVNAPSSNSDSNNLAAFVSGKKYGLFDENFVVTLNPEYDWLDISANSKFYITKKGRQLEIYQPVQGLFPGKWKSISNNWIDDHYLVQEADSGNYTLLHWTDSSGFGVVYPPMTFHKLVQQESFYDKFGLKKEDLKIFDIYPGYHYEYSRKWQETDWQLKNYFLLHFLSRTTAPQSTYNRMQWRGLLVFEDPSRFKTIDSTSEQEKITIVRSSFRTWEYFSATSLFNYFDGSDEGDFKHMQTLAFSNGIASICYGEEYINYNFRASAAPIELKSLFLDWETSKPALESKIISAVAKKGILGRTSLGRIELARIMSDNWAFGEEGLNFHYQLVWVTVPYDEISEELKPEINKIIRKF